MATTFKKKKVDDSSNAWMMTFADLMSLLMCFFVLLLSFSEMDLQTYKQVAGSMKDAFGVQREIKTLDIPKGTSVVAQNFSPGRPSPSVLRIMRQDTIDETKQTLLFTDSLTKKENADDTNDGEIGDRSNRPSNMQQTGTKSGMDTSEGMKISDNSDAVSDNKAISAAMVAGQKLAQKEAKTLADAKTVTAALKEEIKRGMVQVETEGTKILIRIREKGSFPSGSATFQKDFLPVLAKLRKTLAKIPGKVRIAGHTDNVPINTARFRSNWELSSSRAVSVVHELLSEGSLEPARFLVEGHGDANPIAPNDTPEHRALNRRVELTIVQGNDQDKNREFEDIVNNALSKKLEVSEIPAAEAKELPEQTASVEENAIPEVSVEHLNPVNQSAAPVITGEPAPATPSPDTQAISGQQEEDQPDMNKIEERIRRFSEKMKKHKIQN